MSPLPFSGGALVLHPQQHSHPVSLRLCCWALLSEMRGSLLSCVDGPLAAGGVGWGVETEVVRLQNRFPLLCDCAALSFVKPCDARQFPISQTEVKQIKFSQTKADPLTGTNCLKRNHLTVGKIHQSRVSHGASSARARGREVKG